jgi:EAL domain-containing protein (putative c-di-GMP-specific phosphodiesterase class I)/ActR/RegA family two-component response regulator
MTDGGRRLLVVDDERIQRLIVTRAVESVGFTVDGAADLDEAAEWLSRRNYDAIVLDLSLGAREGVSLLHALRGGGADPLVVLISGMDARVRTASCRLAEALGLRVAGALEKPIVPATLRALLRDVRPRETAGQGAAAAVPSAAELASAIDRGEITVAFQPKVALVTRQVTGLEALARWQPAGSEPVPPDLFIPLAERHGLITRLTRQVLRQSLDACRGWRDRHPECGVAVNISPLMLANPELPEEIDAALVEAGVAPGVLIAEVTEGVVIADPLLAIEVLTRLRIKGVRLSIDDFGTGHSSLLSLMRLPFNELKIDRSFVAVCDTDPEAWKIIRATISLAHELGLDVVAEGVESAAVEERLIGVGCDIGQGWRFGRPMPAAAIAAWFEAHAVTMA